MSITVEPQISIDVQNWQPHHHPTSGMMVMILKSKFMLIAFTGLFLIANLLILPGKILPNGLHHEIYRSLSVYEIRQIQVDNVCASMGFNVPHTSNSSTAFSSQKQRNYSASYYAYVEKRPLYKNLLYLNELNLTYCWTRKVASTSWNQIFYNLAFNKTIDGANAHSVAQLLYPNHTLYNAAMSSLKFYFVRHPYERLVSCYRDKFEIGSKSDYIFKTFNPAIIPSKKKDRPTFKEFVEYLISTPVEEYNDHWLPYWMHCQLCTQNFDVIGLMDTLDEDVQYIFDTVNAKERMSKYIFPWSNHKNDKSDTRQLTMSYFNQLSDVEKQKLYSIYEPDFLMFGYDNKGYI